MIIVIVYYICILLLDQEQKLNRGSRYTDLARQVALRYFVIVDCYENTKLINC